MPLVKKPYAACRASPRSRLPRARLLGGAELGRLFVVAVDVRGHRVRLREDPGKSGSARTRSAASAARAATSRRPSSLGRFVTAMPTRPSRTARTGDDGVVDKRRLMLRRRRRSEPVPSARECTRPRRSSAAAAAARARDRRDRARRSRANADLHAAEAGRRRAVRDVRRLPGWPLPQFVNPCRRHASLLPTASIEPQNCGVMPGVRRVAQQPTELAVDDLPCDLRAELEVEPLVVDRPALVRLQVDAAIDARDQLVEGASPGSRWRFVMRTSGMRLQPSARIEPGKPTSREPSQPTSKPSRTIGCGSAGTPSSS